MLRILAALLQAILNELPKGESPRAVAADLAEIRDNHLAHIHEEITKLSGRIGNVEGRLSLLLGAVSLVLMSVVGMLANQILLGG